MVSIRRGCMDILLIALLTLTQRRVRDRTRADGPAARCGWRRWPSHRSAQAALACWTTPRASCRVGAGGHHLHPACSTASSARPPSAGSGGGCATGLSAKVAGIAATAVVVTAITFITIVFGELVPKHRPAVPEPVARGVSPHGAGGRGVPEALRLAAVGLPPTACAAPTAHRHRANPRGDRRRSAPGAWTRA